MFGRQRPAAATCVLVGQDLPSPGKAKKEGAHSLSSSFKKKLLTGLGKLKGLRGGHKDSSKRISTAKSANDLSNLNQGHEPPSTTVDALTNVSLAPLDVSSDVNVAALLRQCQLYSNPACKYIGSVPVVTLGGLRHGLLASQHAVLVLQVGEDPPSQGPDPFPSTLPHGCNGELPAAVVRQPHLGLSRPDSNNPSNCNPPSQPSFSRALHDCRRRQSAEESLTAARGSSDGSGGENIPDHIATALGSVISVTTPLPPPPALPLAVPSSSAPTVAARLNSAIPTSLNSVSAVSPGSGALALGSMARDPSYHDIWTGSVQQHGGSETVAALERTAAQGPSRFAAGLNGACPGGDDDSLAAARQAVRKVTFRAPNGSSRAVPDASASSCGETLSFQLRRSMDSIGIPEAESQRHKRAQMGAGWGGHQSLTVASMTASAAAVKAFGANGGPFLFQGNTGASKRAGGSGVPSIPSATHVASCQLTETPLQIDCRSSNVSSQPLTACPVNAIWYGIADDRGRGVAGSASCCGDDEQIQPEDLAETDEGILGELESDDEMPSMMPQAQAAAAAAAAYYVTSPTACPRSSFDSAPSTAMSAAAAVAARLLAADSPAALQAPPSPGGLSLCLGRSPNGGRVGSSGSRYPHPHPPSPDPCVLPPSPFSSGLQLGSIAEAARGSGTPSSRHSSIAASALTASSASVSSGRAAPPLLLTSPPPDAALYGSFVAASAVEALRASIMLGGVTGSAGAMEAAGGAAASCRPQPPQPPLASIVQVGPGGSGVSAAWTPPNGGNATVVTHTGTTSVSFNVGGCVVGGSEECDTANADDSVGLDPMIVSGGVEGVMGSTDTDRLCQTLYTLLSNHPSLQLIVEDIIRSAMAGRAVVHEQLVVCPRTGPPALLVPSSGSGSGARVGAEASSVSSSGSRGVGDRVGSGGSRFQQHQQQVQRQHQNEHCYNQQCLNGSSSSSITTNTQRNPLDDFLLLQITACYVDNQPMGPHPALGRIPYNRVQQPPPPQQQQYQSAAHRLPALFMYFSRPYSTATIAATAAAATTSTPSPPPAATTTLVLSVSSSALESSSGDQTTTIAISSELLALMQPPPSSPPATATHRHTIPLADAPATHSPTLRRASIARLPPSPHPTSQPPTLNGDQSTTGESATATTACKVPKSRSLSSIFGSLSVPSWVRTSGGPLAGPQGPPGAPSSQRTVPSASLFQRHSLNAAISCQSEAPGLGVRKPQLSAGGGGGGGGGVEGSSMHSPPNANADADAAPTRRGATTNSLARSSFRTGSVTAVVAAMFGSVDAATAAAKRAASLPLSQHLQHQQHQLPNQQQHKQGAVAPPRPLVADGALSGDASTEVPAAAAAVEAVAAGNGGGAALEVMCAHLRLEQALLAHIPQAVTVMALDDGRVLYQNGRSVAFMGNAVGGPKPLPGMDVNHPEHTLQKIFAYDTTALQSMWETVHTGKTWSGLVCMPPHLDPLNHTPLQPPSTTLSPVTAQPTNPWAAAAAVMGCGTSNGTIAAAAASGGGAGGWGGSDADSAFDAEPDLAPEPDIVGRLLNRLRQPITSTSNRASASRQRPTGSAAEKVGALGALPAAGTAAAEVATSSAARCGWLPAAASGGAARAWVPGSVQDNELSNRGGRRWDTTTTTTNNNNNNNNNAAAASSPQMMFSSAASESYISARVAPLERTAVAATASGRVAASDFRPAANLPRNISAPSFRSVGFGARPLPSVQEAEAAAANADRTHAASYSRTGIVTPNAVRHASLNTHHSFPCLPPAALLYSSSPLSTSGSSFGPWGLSGGGGGGGVASASAFPGLGLSGASPARGHHLPSSCRTQRIHRSNSLVQTEHVLGGSYRAMRIAASAMSQRHLKTGPSGVAVGGSGGGAAGGGSGSLIYGSVDALPLSSPKGAMDMPGMGLLNGNAAEQYTPGGNKHCLLVSAASPASAVAVTASAQGQMTSPCTGGPWDCQALSGIGASAAAGGGGVDAVQKLRPVPFPRMPPPSASRPCMDDTSVAAAAAAASSPTALACGLPYGCSWCEVQASLLTDPVTQKVSLLLVQQDVSSYVQGELEVRQVLDAEHRILEECFPRHVLEILTSDMRRASAMGAATCGLGTAARSPLMRSASSVACYGRNSQPPSSNGRNDNCQAGAAAPMAASTSADAKVASASAMYGHERLNCSGDFSRSSAPVLSRHQTTSLAHGAMVAVTARTVATGALPAASTDSGAATAATRASAQSPVNADAATSASALTNPFSNCRASTMTSGVVVGGERRSHSTALAASCSLLASFNYSSYMTNGIYDSDDVRTSFSQNLQGVSGEMSGTMEAMAATYMSPSHLRGLAVAAPQPPASTMTPAVTPGVAAVAPTTAAAPLSLSLPSVATPLATPTSPVAAPTGVCGVSAGLDVSGSTNLLSPRTTLGGLGASAAMSSSQQYMARSHEEVTVLFADIASFTSMCGQVPPQTVMSFLNDLFTQFDQLVELHGVYKVETIGDCYMVCGGLVEEDAEGFRSVTENVDPLHAHKVFAFAVDMLAAASRVTLPGSGQSVQLRVGIHSGPVMSGVVGCKMPRFCLFGDTVNVASRMESTGVPGAIHVSDSTRTLLGPLADSFLPTGGMTVKGKGSMYTYLHDPTGAAARTLANRPSQQLSSGIISGAEAPRDTGSSRPVADSARGSAGAEQFGVPVLPPDDTYEDASTP